jgi:hypothetical protein
MSISSQAQEAFDHVYDWFKRDPWKSRFMQFFEETLAELAEINEIEVQELTLQAETQGWASQVMRGMTEYFAELLFEIEPHNVVDDYLKRRGWKETPIGRQYLEELSTTPVRLYQVQAVVLGVSITVQDLIEPEKVVIVPEVLGSQAIGVGEFLLAKVIEVQETPYFTGSLFKLRSEDALEWASEIREILVAEETDPEDEEAVAALFQDLRVDLLGDAVAYLLNPLPTITNTDGHLYLQSEIRFPVLTEAETISRTLDSLPDFERESPETLNWIWFDPQRSSKNQFTVLGSVKLTSKWLKSEVNSQERAKALSDYLQTVLPEALGQAVITYQSVKSLLDEADHLEDNHPALDLSAEEVQQVVHEALDEQYRQTLDQPIPMLGNLSPKAAVQSANGRKQVIQWLLHLEQSSQQRDPVLAAYDFGWLWEELGISRFEHPQE